VGVVVSKEFEPMTPGDQELYKTQKEFYDTYLHQYGREIVEYRAKHGQAGLDIFVIETLAYQATAINFIMAALGIKQIEGIPVEMEET
jgi:hypothetical protein